MKRKLRISPLKIFSAIITISLFSAVALVSGELKAASKIRGLVVQMNQYDRAVSLFSDKYGFMPGDLPAAETFGFTNGSGNAEYLMQRMTIRN